MIRDHFMTDTFEKIRALMAAEFHLDPRSIRPETPLIDLGVDSLAALEFVFDLEDSFRITLRTADRSARRTGQRCRRCRRRRARARGGAERRRLRTSVRRVVITGLGAVSAIGASAQETFEAALAGRSGVRCAPSLAVEQSIPVVAAARFDTGLVYRRASAACPSIADRACARGRSPGRRRCPGTGHDVDCCANGCLLGDQRRRR
jgi:acyl carrier protein